MNKPTLYFLTLTTALGAASCTYPKPKNIVSAKNNAGENIEIRLEVTPVLYYTDKGNVTFPDNDSTLTITNINKETKLIYENKANSLRQKSAGVVDKIISYKTTGSVREAILRNTYIEFVLGKDKELTDTLFVTADNDWRSKINYINDVIAKEKKEELDRVNAKKENEYNKLRQKVYKTIDQIRR